MLMRVAIGIHREDLDAVLETYTLLSEKWFTHASPTLFNAGTCRPQLSSCFLLSMKEDSIDVGGLCTSHITSLCSVMTPTPPPHPTQHLYVTQLCETLQLASTDHHTGVYIQLTMADRPTSPHCRRHSHSHSHAVLKQPSASLPPLMTDLAGETVHCEDILQQTRGTARALLLSGMRLDCVQRRRALCGSRSRGERCAGG